MEVPGLLVNLAAGVQDRCLAAHLVADRHLDAFERVDVLGLGTGAELGATDRPQRHVGVAPQRALIHPDVGNIQRAQQIPQRGHIGPGDFGCAVAGALDRLGDDLDQRHPGPVDVEQRGGGTVDSAGVAAHVGELAGVLLHVRALDLHPEGAAVLERDVEVAAERDRLVVLGDLIVLRLIGIEVVLPGEPAPRGDLAIQREADPDGRLDGRRVERRQRSGQAQAHRAHLGVGFGAEIGGAAAEHLGHRRQFDVHLEAEDGVEPCDDVVVVEKFGVDGFHGPSHAADPSGAGSPDPPPAEQTRNRTRQAGYVRVSVCSRSRT